MPGPARTRPEIVGAVPRRGVRFLPLLGFLSLLWCLVRVIPKPSRAAYPCQRAAFPLASGFVLWVLGLATSFVVFRRAAWQALFPDFHAARGRGEMGYQSGEKIAIKLNLNQIGSYQHPGEANFICPQMVLATVRQLVDESPLPDQIALANYPNPFNASTAVSFDLPRDLEARLGIYNGLGQEVARLRDGLVPAGAHTAVWDGTDRQGRALGSGIYLARLTAGSRETVRKLALVR